MKKITISMMKVVLRLLLVCLYIQGNVAQMLGCFLNGAMSPFLARSNGVQFCSGTDSSLLFGDFTGNGAIDLLCHNNNTGQFQLFNIRTAQIFPLPGIFCINGNNVASADVDGDKRMDVLCVERNGKVSYLLNSNEGGIFADDPKSTDHIFCNTENQNNTFLTGDLNNDGKDDIICHESNGNIHYAISNKTGTESAFSTVSVVKAEWCNNSTDKVFSGDLDGDGTVDLLCHSSRQSVKSVMSFHEGSGFENFTLPNELQFCEGENSFILMKDINGDGFHDLVCKDKSKKGLTEILQNTPGSYFTEHSVRHSFQFCAHGGERNFFLADINRDGMHDLICQTDTGKRFIFLSRCF